MIFETTTSRHSEERLHTEDYIIIVIAMVILQPERRVLTHRIALTHEIERRLTYHPMGSASTFQRPSVSIGQ
jgi:hypothetical protein